MKKTFNININGIIFHIDEDAYQKLNAYLEQLKSHFRNTDGREEIISDIESRIAEILQSKLDDKKQVVGIEDVNEVIRIMGQPFEFTEEAEEAEAGSGSGEKARYYTPQKRLYRDPDNKIIGGVASGIAAYLNVDSIWIRLLFLIALIPGFLGLWVYIILWIVMPEAMTTAERLEMRGEPVNISNIEKSIKDEFEDLKSRLNDLSNKAKETYKKKREGSTTVFESILGVFVEAFKLIGKGLIILIGIAVTFLAVGLIIPFLVSVFGWHSPLFIDEHEVIIFSLPYFSEILLGPGSSTGLFITALILFIGIPIMMMLYLGVKMIFALPRTRFVGASAFSLWIISLIFMLFYSFRVYSYFRHEGDVVIKQNIEMPADETIRLHMYDNRDPFTDSDTYYLNVDDDRVLFTEGKNILITPRINIRASDDDEIRLVKHGYARGKSRRQARDIASDINYRYKVDDNNLVLNRYFVIDDGDPFRAQDLKITLYFPVGTVLYIDENIEDMLNYWYHSYSEKRSGNYWIMTEGGLEEYEPENEEEVQEGFIEQTSQRIKKPKSMHLTGFNVMTGYFKAVARTI